MAAGDFTAAAARAARAMAGNYFASSPIQRLNSKPAVTAQALTFEQTGMVDADIFRAGNNCKGVEVLFQKYGDTHAYSGDISGDTLTCDLTACDEGEAVALHIEALKHERVCVTVDTSTCASDLDADTRRARALAQAYQDLRTGFDKVAIAFLEANAQVNLDSDVTNIDLGNGAWTNTPTDLISMPAGDMASPDGMATAEVVAQINRIGDHFWVHGRNGWFTNQFMMSFAEDNIGCCDRNAWAMYNGGRHYWDTVWMDTTLTPASNAFAINPDSYMFVNRVVAPAFDPTPVFGKPDTWTWAVNDPQWTWSNGGTQIPVTYNVTMQQKCTGTDAVGRRIGKEVYELTLTYDLVAIPEDADNVTGIVHFAAQ